MNKPLLLFISLLLSVVALCVQTTENNNNNPYNLPLSNEEFFEQAEIVFEGNFINVVATYDTKGSGKFDDCYRIVAHRVQRVYKGTQYTAGDTIYIVSKGAFLGEEVWSAMYEDRYIELGICGIGCIVNAYSPKVYFLSNSDLPDDINSKYFSYEKYKEMEKANSGRYQLDVDRFNKMFVCGNKIVGLDSLVFHNREDFYNHMRQFKGFTLPNSAPQPQKQPESEAINKADFEFLQIDKAKLDSLTNQIMQEHYLKDSKKKVQSNSENSEEYNTLTLLIANQQVTQESQKRYLEFDVYKQLFYFSIFAPTKTLLL